MVRGGRETWKKETLIWKKKFWINNPNVILNNLETRHYLKQLQTQNLIVPIDKANNRIAFVCKTFFVKTNLEELGFQTWLTTKTDKISNDNKIDLTQHNIINSSTIPC